MERTLAFLVAASPAALLLTVATAYRAAMANGMRHGVLFRGQDELEILGTVKTIAFDKTGTLTGGKPVVSGVVNCGTGWTDDEILVRAAAAELRSGHRLGNAIVNPPKRARLEIPEPTEFTPSPGKGIIATVDGRTVAVGNANLFAELGVNIWRAIEISADMRDEGQSAVLVGDRENVRGVIGVSDPLRPNAPEIVDDLSHLKIRRTAMLTGDDEVVANVIASAAGLREVYADLLPEEKLGVVRQMEQSAPVGMIAGAGENSPTLAIATSGIALGSVSSDVTREPAGVLLFGGELSELPFALWIAQTARRTTNVGHWSDHRRHGDSRHWRAGGRHPAAGGHSHLVRRHPARAAGRTAPLHRHPPHAPPPCRHRSPSSTSTPPRPPPPSPNPATSSTTMKTTMTICRRPGKRSPPVVAEAVSQLVVVKGLCALPHLSNWS